MAKHTEPPESGADNSSDHSADNAADHPVDDPADIPHTDSAQDFSQDFNPDVDPASASPPARFGRLALWAASASALTVGVAATVAYGVWFDQDQRTYAKAMAVAQHTLSSGVAVAQEQQSLADGTATVRAQPGAWSGRVALASPPPAPATAPAAPAELADADPVTSDTPAQPESTRVAATDSVARQSAVAQSATLSCSVKQAQRHRPALHGKPNKGLFARIGSFFHRVSYRQHGNASQQDTYGHS